VYDVVIEVLNHSGTAGASSITVQIALGILRSLSHSCWKAREIQ